MSDGCHECNYRSYVRYPNGGDEDCPWCKPPECPECGYDLEHPEDECQECLEIERERWEDLKTDDRRLPF